MELEICRLEIDEIDKKILSLLGQRAEAAGRIGIIKARAGLPILDRDREDDVLRRVSGRNEAIIPDDSVVRIFRRIIVESRRMQASAVSEHLKKRTEIGQ